MKIAIFTDTYSPEINGIVTSITNFTTRMAKRGHKIYIFCPKYDRKKDIPQKNIEVYRYISFSFATNKNTKLAFPSLFTIVNKLDEIKPDIIHSQTPMNIGMTGVMAAKILKIPNIQTYHTYIPDFMVYLSPKKLLGIDGFYEQIRDSKVLRSIYQTRAFRKIIKTRKNLNESEFSKNLEKAFKTQKRVKRFDLTERFAWDFTRFLYGRADLVLAPSNALVTSLKKHKLKAPAEFQSNGIEYNYFPKKTNYLIHQKIVHVGRLGLEKDVDIVIKAINILRKDYPNIKLDIVGDGPARQSLEKLVKKLKLENNVKFLGFVPRSKIRTKLKSYDFFATASAIETQGLVILEAMAAGLPAIGVKKLAVPEIVINDKSGYLAKPKNPKSFAEKMRLLLQSKKKNKRLGTGAMEVALSHHIYGEVEKLENYYSETVFKYLNKKRS